MNMKDLLNLTCNRELVVMQDIVYPVMSVSRYKKVADLLREFQKGHAHLAVVMDENNKVEGIVTLEDLLEEIVGEIEDEYDIRLPDDKKPPAA
jgi:CBS domain containing-hemolysin-like protein